MREPLLTVEGLTKLYPVEKNFFRRTRDFVHAVDGIDFEVGQGESLGLVGESGCGKTTTGRILTKLTDATTGQIRLKDDGQMIDVAHISRENMRRFRHQVQMIFQDPYESMNPRRTAYDTIAEPLQVQGIGTRLDREGMVADLLHRVGLTPPQSFMWRFPHELSGGQRQRVAIARALVVNPNFIVADEPTSMLDVSIRISIMELMLRLGQEFDVSYLYITHDLAVARYMCDRIAVMYNGKIVELAESDELLQNPLHPYTRALISAVPVPDPSIRRPVVEIKGGITKPINPPPECRFIERCPWAAEVCRENPHPPLEEKAPGHYAACYRTEEVLGGLAPGQL